MVRHFRAILAFALVLLSTEAMAVEIDAQIGFGSKCRAGSWTPYSITLKNDDSSSFAGTIAAINKVTEQPNPWRTSMEITGTSQKRYSGYTLEETTSSAEVLKILLENGRLPGGNKDTLQCPVQQIYPNNLLMVAVGSSKSTLNFLDGVALTKTQPKPGKSSQTIYAIDAAMSAPETLPDRPLGYDSVDVLVLSELNPRQMDTKQLTAIKMWAAGGGIVVINGGPDYQRFQNDFYKDLLPVDVTGAAELGLSSLGAHYGFSIDPGRTVVTSGKLKSGATAMVSQDGVPLISYQTYGLGQVYFLAFDYSAFPLKGWDGQENMWKQLLFSTRSGLPLASPLRFSEGQNSAMQSSGTPVALPPVVVMTKKTATAPAYKMRPHRNQDYYQNGSNTYESMASDIPSVGMPSAQVIIFFLVSYLLCLVPLNYFILTKKKRRELAWFTTPAIIIIFTIGAYGLGYAMKGSSLLLKTVTIVETGPNTNYASATTYGVLFSPSRRSYDIKVDDPYAVVSETPAPSYDHFGNKQKDNRRLTVLIGETTALPDISMDMWSMRTFRVESGCDTGGKIDSNLKIDKTNGTIVGTIRNNTSYDLVDCRIVTGNQTTVNIGDIQSGMQREINAKSASPSSAPAPKPGPNGIIPLSTPQGTTDAQPSADASPIEQARYSARAEILMIVFRTKRPALVGRIKQPVSKISLEQRRGERQSIDYFICWLDSGKGGAR
ncbi:MAG: hypothetical protein ABFD64_04350 [Armatimonadota bacterium]